MKTIEELYNEVMASDELKKEFCALKTEEVEAFAEKHGCKATLDEIRAFLTEKSTKSGELSDNEIEQAAGGKTGSTRDVLLTVFTAGVVCGLLAGISAEGGSCGTAIEGEGFLCGL